MTINKLTKEIIARKEKLYKMLEQSSNIQTEDIIEFSQELDELIKNYYLLTGFCSEKIIKYKIMR